jgi:transcriptional regulator with XRE-family HTH domain
MVMDTERPKETKGMVAARLLSIRGPRYQEAFASRLGLSQAALSKYERGLIPKSWLFLQRLHDDEGVDLNALLTSRDNG